MPSSDKKTEKKKQEQPVDPEDGHDEYADDDYDEGCFPELARWQLIAIVAVVVCVAIGVAVAAVVIFVSGGDSDDGGSGGGVKYPSDQIFHVQVENQYLHGTLGSATYAVEYYMKAGESLREDTNKPSTDITTTLSSTQGGIAGLDVTVIIDFDTNGSVDCRDDFYTSVDIDSGDFGEWTSQESCTYTLGGTYLHKVRAKVTPQ